MGALLRRFRWVAAAVVATAAIAIGVVLALPSHAQRVLPPARARTYTAFTACLLTDASGLTDEQAVPVWQGMQAASKQTSGKVSYLAASGPDTEQNAAIFINTLAQRRCDLILAVGPSEIGAAQAQAAIFKTARFVLVGGGQTAANVIVVPGGSAPEVAAGVQHVVAQAAGSASS